MLIEVSKIVVTDRIRKDYGDIEDLANDIKENGLINPPVVTPDFELIAGERRLRALRHLGYEQIEVRIMKVNDVEHMLKLEINENENRKDFTRLERLDYARKLERIERVKAKERSSANLKQNTDMVNLPTREKGNTRDIVAKNVGISNGRQYDLEKYVARNADEETLEQWDRGEITTNKAYLRIKELENKIKELENKKPKVVEKIIEKEIYPDDYDQIKDELNKLKKDSKTNITGDDFENLYKFRINNFKNTIEACTIAINPFIFMDNIYEKMDTQHKNILLNEVSKLEKDIEDLKKQIIFHGGIVNE